MQQRDHARSLSGSDLDTDQLRAIGASSKGSLPGGEVANKQHTHTTKHSKFFWSWGTRDGRSSLDGGAIFLLFSFLFFSSFLLGVK